MKPPQPNPQPIEDGDANLVQAIQEPYDSIVRILSKLQHRAARKDLTGIYDAANEIMKLVESDRQQHVREAKQFFADDITQCFIPKCCQCNRRATEQTTKGKYAQDNLHRPVNWGYYCKKHADEGRELEREAMYG